MTKGVTKKTQRDDRLREKRAQAASGRLQGAKRSRSVGRDEPLPAHSYPIKRVAIGKRQTAGSGE